MASQVCLNLSHPCLTHCETIIYCTLCNLNLHTTETNLVRGFHENAEAFCRHQLQFGSNAQGQFPDPCVGAHLKDLCRAERHYDTSRHSQKHPLHTSQTTNPNASNTYTRPRKKNLSCEYLFIYLQQCMLEFEFYFTFLTE